MQLRTEREPWRLTWMQLAHHILPNRGRWLETPNAPRGRQKQQEIIDRTGSKAIQRLASFLMAGITSPSRAWFRLGTGDDELDAMDEVKTWLALVEKRMANVLASGNFYNSIGVLYEELSCFGTGSMIVLRDFHDVCRFYTLTAGEFHIGLNDRLEPDALYRVYVMNTRQLVARFGADACSPTVQGFWRERRLDQEVVVVCACQPNLDQRKGALDWRGMPWTTLHFELAWEQDFLRIEGHHEKPFVAPRWNVVSNDAYGRGPGEEALPDVKSLQLVQRRMAQAIDKLVTPPMLGDKSMENQAISLLPGAINYVPGLGEKTGLRPVYEMPPNIQALAEKVQDLRNTIKETFYNDLILMISQMEQAQPVTAEEIRAREQEKLLMLGPMLERFHNECLSPLIDIVFGIMHRGGLVPRPPDALKGRDIKPQFISVLAQAQKAVNTTAIEQLLKLAGSMAAVWPHVVDKVDPDAAVADYGDALAVDPRIIVPQDKVDEIRQQRGQAQAQAQQAQNAMAVAQGAQTLSKTDVGSGQNALQAMIGMQGGGAPQQ